MIEVKHLTKKYGAVYAVRDISFTVEKGHIYGFLGPNGAGKSTTMNIITGCLAATEGDVTVNGYDIYEDSVKAKRCIGYLPENPPLYTDMTPREYLRFVGRAKGVKKEDIDGELEAVMEKTGVTSVADRLIKNLSKGYKQRVGIAQALLGNPEFIILDEPTVGLDPLQLIGIRELIISLKKDHGVILSSHIMGEIESVCDYVTMIYGGQIVASDSYESLEKAYSGTVCFKLSGSKEEASSALSEVDGITYLRVSENGRFVKAVMEGDTGLRERACAAFENAGITVLSADDEFNLEDCFVKLMETHKPEEVPEEKKPKRLRVKSSYDPLGGAYLEEDSKENSAESGYNPLFADKGDEKGTQDEPPCETDDEGGETK